MKKFMVAGLAAVMSVTGAVQFTFAKSEKTELFAFDETIQVYDKTSGEEIEKADIPSGSKVGIESNLATWGASNAAQLNASVVSDEINSSGDAFKIHYEEKLNSDSGEFLRVDSLSVDYTDITEEKPVVLAFKVKSDWADTASMNACIDVVPVIKPASGSALERNPFTQQSIQPKTDNGEWLDVKYVIKKVTVSDDKASFTFDRYVNTEKKLSDTVAEMAAGSGEGAKLIGFKIRPRARTTTYNDGGYMDITFDNIQIYREETIIPTGTKWGEDLTIDEENKPGAIEHGTVIGDNNTVTQYKLANTDGSVEGYSAEITEDNSDLIVKNVSSTDGYKTTLIPVSAKKYTSADISKNGAMVYEARYKLDYNRNAEGTTSYSAVQMYFDFYYNADNKTMQFAVPANTVQSGEYITVKIVIPKNVFGKSGRPHVFANDTAITLNDTNVANFVNNIEYVTLRRVVLANKTRNGQEIGEQESAVTLTLDYLDQYLIEENDEFDITSDKSEDEISLETEGVNFTAARYIDETTLQNAVLKKKAADGSYEELELGTYGIKATSAKSFYIGFGDSLVPGAEYEIDLTAVKDIYGNGTDTKLHFSTETISEGSIEWIDCSVSGDTISYKLENSTNSDAQGTVYTAVVEKQSGTLKTCQSESVSVSANNAFEGTIAINAFDSENEEVRLFFWNDKNMSYTSKKTVPVE